MLIGTCARCGQEKRLRSKKSGACSACYMQLNRKESPEAYARHKAAVTKYAKDHPGKRRQWVHTYRLSVGQQIPDELHELRTAIKRVENAVATANQRQRIRRAG